MSTFTGRRLVDGGLFGRCELPYQYGRSGFADGESSANCSFSDLFGQSLCLRPDGDVHGDRAQRSHRHHPVPGWRRKPERTCPIAGGVAALATATGGNTSITAAYSGDGSHGATSDVLLQLVTPAILTVTANNITRTFNQPNGPLSYTITGFIGSDTQASSVTGTPTLLTTATEASPVGYLSDWSGWERSPSSNYTFMFVNGSLTVTKATPGTGGPPAVTVASSINPSFRGENVTFTATLPPNATGQVTFMDGTGLWAPPPSSARPPPSPPRHSRSERIPSQRYIAAIRTIPEPRPRSLAGGEQDDPPGHRQ